jgi:putative ABC transport system permease protein
MQRVAIARAIVNDPDIILADEPTGALDSGNAENIMRILREIARDRLVVVVSHNLALAEQYADRIVELFDGRVVGDTNPVVKSPEKERYQKTKTAMSFPVAARIGIKHMLRAKLRTLLTIFAGCIGIIGVGLVLAISNGVNVYIENVQRSALANYPITINSSARRKDESVLPQWERFPDKSKQTINIRKGQSILDYYNVIDEAFLEHLEKMDKEHYTVINYRLKVTMNMITKFGDDYYRVFDSIFTELAEDDFILDQYDVLYGTFPQQANEIALLVDEYNAVEAYILDYMGFDYESHEYYTFDDIIGKEFRLINNDDFYVKNGDRYQTRSMLLYPEMYENSEMSLTITAIMRVKPNAMTKLYYSTGILYTRALTEKVLNDAANSQIVKDQIAGGLDYNVFTGQPFEKIVDSSSTRSPEYQYKQNLVTLGAIARTTSIDIYTESFTDRFYIQSYLAGYENNNEEINISFRDYIHEVTTEFASMVKVFSSVLIIFSMVSLIVSAILIGIITYISVVERIREIGLLRSIGARKIDIARLFITETAIIGLFSGLMGVFGALLLVRPVNEFVVDLIREYTISFPGISQVIVAKFEFIYFIILVFGSMFLTIIAGIIPAFIASRKLPIKALRTEG